MKCWNFNLDNYDICVLRSKGLNYPCFIVLFTADLYVVFWGNECDLLD